MTRILPQSTDYLNSPDHSFLHRVVSVDTGSPVSSIDIDASGNVTITNGNVGIRTTSPGAPLDVKGKTIVHNTNGDTTAIFDYSASTLYGPLYLRPQAQYGTSGLVVNTSASWGGWDRNLMTIAAEDNTALWNLGGYGVSGTTLGYAYAGNAYNDTLQRWYPATKYVTFDGNVGIGTTNQQAGLALDGKKLAICADGDCWTGANGIGNSNSSFIMSKQDSPFMTMVDYGNATFSTGLNPSGLVNFAGDNANTEFAFGRMTGWTNFPTLTTEYMRIKSNGNVSIGTTASGSKLTVSGHIGTLGTIPTLTSAGTGATITTGSTDTAGEITEGTLATGAVITFATAYTNAPFVTVVSESGLVFSYTVSNTAITITNIGALSSTKLTYHCVANDS